MTESDPQPKSGWAYLWFTLIGLAGFIAVAILVWVTATSFWA